MFSILTNGFILGWSVAWPPGPVNAEMIRRGLLPKDSGGGFWAAWPIGIGACLGDFTWAFGVSLGAGALLNSISVRRALAVVSLVLLIVLALTFARSAWRIFQSHHAFSPDPSPEQRSRKGLLLGLFFAFTSPWNVGFWLAVIGGQTTQRSATLQQSLILATAVVLGALAFSLVLCVAVKFGARLFSRPGWQITTEILTALVMLWFAGRLLLHFP